MVTIQPRAAEAFFRKPDPHLAVVLLYGPDHGLVAERSASLLAGSVDDPQDPFQLVKLEGDELASDPARLVDEASTIPLFGGRRAIRVRAGQKSLVPAVELSRAAAVIACYGDESLSIQTIIAEEMGAAGLAIAPEARDALVDLLGGDRLASRQELRKLALYAHGAGRVELSDVAATVGDASAFAMDEVVDAAFSGDLEALERKLERALAEGNAPSTLAGAALRHALLLHRLRAEVERGRSATLVVDQARGIGGPRRKTVSAELAALDQTRLDRIVADLAETVLETRREARLGAAILSRALMRIALAARPPRR
jgi:DNA polymerase III subunit delta